MRSRQRNSPTDVPPPYRFDKVIIRLPLGGAVNPEMLRNQSFQPHRDLQKTPRRVDSCNRSQTARAICPLRSGEEGPF